MGGDKMGRKRHVADESSRGPTKLSGVIGAKPISNARFWIDPLVITLVALMGLAGLYLSSILKPTDNTQHFPLAVVNADAGDGGTRILNSLSAILDTNKFDIRVMPAPDAAAQLDSARVYGILLIPSDFSTNFEDIPRKVADPQHITRPTVTIMTNPRSGSIASGVANQALSNAMAVINQKVGQQILASVAKQAEGAQINGGLALLLANPINIRTDVYNPMTEGTGNGLTPFYYALLLVVAGFVGSVVINALADSIFGDAPARVGPAYRSAGGISRFGALLVKWGLILVFATLASALYMALAAALSMPLQNGVTLWLYGVFAITAVGVTSVSLITALGSVGVLVSVFVFLLLGLPSAGGGVPLELQPSFVAWVTRTEPLYQVFMGTRALLYLGGRADAGLSQAIIAAGIGMAFGFILGGVVTRLCDRWGYREQAAGAPVTDSKVDKPAKAADTGDVSADVSGAVSGSTDAESKPATAEVSE